MNRRLNRKNKLFIMLFIVEVLVIIGILIYSVVLSGHDSKQTINIDKNNVLFASDFSNINTEHGGKVEKTWGDGYRYLSNDDRSYSLGDTPVVFNMLNDEIIILGTKYQILNDGTVSKDDGITTIQNTTKPSFYKLQDRKYLIVCNDISDDSKVIYTKKYLIVEIDKQGNASLLNDAINVKTINPIKISFADYIFDVANEKLVHENNIIDLKQVIGSTNEYVEKEVKENEIEYDSKELLESYNELVNDFTQYAKNHDYSISANNQISGGMTNIVINNNSNNTSSETNKPKDDSNNDNSNSNTNSNNMVNNKTEIMKRVSLRGVVTSPSYIDVSYIVTDPENKYQAVYLLITGNINGTMTTEKIVIDKYDTRCRITGVLPNNEYTISLGYIEIVVDGEDKNLVDNIEDVINVRTANIEYKFVIEKIAFSRVYFNYRMTSKYAFESADIAFIVDDEEKVSIPVDYNKMISDKGFSASFELSEGNIYELRVKNARYNERMMDVNIYKKFTLTK